MHGHMNVKKLRICLNPSMIVLMMKYDDISASSW
jgi:hypothetical protein